MELFICLIQPPFYRISKLKTFLATNLANESLCRIHLPNSPFGIFDEISAIHNGATECTLNIIKDHYDNIDCSIFPIYS